MSYRKKTWVTKEIIKAVDLNHIEDGIYNLDQQTSQDSEAIENAYKTTDTTVSSISDDDLVPFLDNQTGQKKKTLFSNFVRNIEGLLGSAAYKNVPESGNASSTEVVKGDDTRLSDSRNAKDVYSWAKQQYKPSYSAEELGVVSTEYDQELSSEQQAIARTNIGAGTGDYDDLSHKPTIGNATLTIQQNGTTKGTFTSNSTTDATANIVVPTKTSDITNDSGFITAAALPTVNNGTLTIQQNGTSKGTFTANQAGNTTANIVVPTKTSDLTNDSDFAVASDLATVATSGSYNDLSDKPTIGNATLTIQRNGSNVKTFTANATSNVTANITVPTKTSDLTNDSNFVASEDLATVATSGSYNDLTNRPTIPTVNNATLTIQQNGTTKGTFTANASSNTTANITVPTKTSDITNDSGFITSADIGVSGVKGSSESSYRTGDVNITAANIGLGNVGNFKAVSTVASQGLTDTEKSNARANIGAGTSSFSGNYNDLTNKPTIPTVNNATLTIQKNGTNVTTFTANASSNATANISVPTKTSDLTNDSGFITSASVGVTSVATGNGLKGGTITSTGTISTNVPRVAKDSKSLPGANSWVLEEYSAGTNYNLPSNHWYYIFSMQGSDTGYGAQLALGMTTNAAYYRVYNSSTWGSWQSIINTVPTVNNGTLTIQKNGTNVQTFTANQSSSVTANITVPTKTSDITNDSGFITSSDIGVSGVKGNSESSYRTGNVNITAANIGLGNVGNFKAVSTVASQGLTDTEKSNARANIGAGTSSFSGSYTDLSNKPTIPTVNNATLTIQKNGTNVTTFTANSSTNATANITVPTKTSDLTNDSGFVTSSTSGVSSVATGTSNGTISVTTNGSTANVAVKGLGSAAYTASTAYAAASHTHNYAGSSSAGGNANAAIILERNVAVTNTSGMQYTVGQLTIGTADGNAKEGSNASYKLWSYPAGGTSVSSTSANIDNVRLYWSSTYFRDIFMSPNNNAIYHRSVLNNTAGDWYQIFDTGHKPSWSDISSKPSSFTPSSHTHTKSQITDFPTIPTVNNATLTIQKNGTAVKTFTANASTDVTCNITVPTKTSELTNDSGYITSAGVTGVKGNSESSYRTGNVNITAANIGLGNVGNFKAVSTVASQGLTDTEKSNARANIGAGTSSFSGSYNDLTNKPTIPTVNNATLTIQKNGTAVKTFTANASSDVTCNITVPTKTSDLTNDSGYTTNTGTVTSVKVGDTSYSPSSGVISLPAYPTDTNNAVTQTATTTSANYEVLFSVTADNTTRTEGARKNSNLKFNPSTGNLQATQLNGVTIGTPKFTDTRDFKLGTSRSGATDNTLYFVYST